MTNTQSAGSLNLQDLLDLLEQSAVCANEIGIPQSIVDRALRSIRLKDGDTRGWSNPLTAAVVDLTERQIRNIKSVESREAYDAELSEWDERHRKGHPIHQMLMSAQIELMTCGDFAKSLCRKEEHVRPFVREAVDQGYLESVEGSRPTAYRATGRVYLHERSSTMIKRFGVVERASLVLKEVPRAGRIRKLSAKLTAEGAAWVRDYFNPRNPDFPTLVVATEREGQTHEQRGRTDLVRTFGSVVTFGRANHAKETPMETARRHALDYPTQTSTSEVLPTRCGLDELATRQYLEQDYPAIIKNLQKVLAEASRMGDGDREKFDLVLACTPTPVPEEKAEPRPKASASRGKVALVALLVLLCPFVFSASGCGGVDDPDLVGGEWALTVDPTDAAGVEHGDPDEAEHGDPDGVEHGDPDGVEHGDPDGVEHGNLDGVEHGDPEEVEHGDDENTGEIDPEDLRAFLEALRLMAERSKSNSWDDLF